tara:strand:+ start:2305 stop:4032 length:1728 start_codon:yes stop_codon:yes gene_type:complete
MADKTPIRLVFDGSTPTGIAEYQSGDTIANSFLTNSGFQVVDDSSTATTISLGESLKIAGATGITTSISGDSVSVDLDDTAVTPATYGSATAIPAFTVDQQGRITSASNVSIATQLSIVDDSSSALTIDLLTDTLKISGDTGITTDVSGDTIKIDLDNTAVTAGSYGSATSIPTFTVDQQGRLTAAGSASVATNLTIVDDSSTSATISLLSDTLKIAGTSNEISTSISGDTISIALPDDVTIGRDLTVTRNAVISTMTPSGDFTLDAGGDIILDSDGADTILKDGGTEFGRFTNSSGELVIKSSSSGTTALTMTGANVAIAGNLTVNGSTTTVSSTNTTVADNLLELNSGASSNANDSGLIIERGSTGDNAIIAWDESADKFILGTTTATASDTGNLTIAAATVVANLEGNVTSTSGTTSLNNLSVTGNTTLGNATSDTITVTGRFATALVPDTNITYDLGTSSLRWRDIYLSGNTIDLNGATISGDGSGAISISASGASLPTGSTVGNFKIANSDPSTGLGVREVPLFTSAGGLGTAAKTFKFGLTAISNIFTQNHAFTLSTGSNATPVSLFDF